MKELKLIANDDGVFEEYDDTYDLTIHCTSQEEQDEWLMKLNRTVCTDAISRQAAINVAVDAVDDWDGGCNKTREEYIRKALETIPPVAPAERVGQWEWVQYDSNPNIGNWHCSECRFITPQKFRYCPYCGAKMCGGKV